MILFLVLFVAAVFEVAASSVNLSKKVNARTAIIPIIETKKALDAVRAKGIHPYYWELSQTVGHFNYEGNAAFGNYLASEIRPYLK